MGNKNLNKKVNLKDKLINIIVYLSVILLIFMVVISVIAWEKKNDLVFIISGSIGALGVLFNIYLYSREKSPKNKNHYD